MPVPNVVSDMTQTAATNSPSGSEVVAPNLDNYLRALSAFIRQDQSVASSAIAAASTVDLTNTDGKHVIVTGSANITSLGVGFVGEDRTVYFNASGSILVNSSGLVLPYATNITVVAGDCFTFRCTAASTWVLTAKGKVYSSDVINALGYTPPNDSAVVHIAGTETITGGKTFGGNTGQYVLRINGGNTNTADGAAVFFLANGTTLNAIGTYSAILGSAYDARFCIYGPNGIVLQHFTTAAAGLNSLSTIGVFNGPTSSQQAMFRLGWNNGIVRWSPVIESNASLSFYAYDSSGASPYQAFNFSTAVAGTGSNLFTVNASISAGGTVGDGIGDVRILPQNTQNANYTFVLSDKGKFINKSASTAYTYTIPPNSSVAFPVGTMITVVNNGNSTQNITINPGSGVSLYKNGVSGSFAVVPGQMVTLLYIGSDFWQA